MCCLGGKNSVVKGLKHVLAVSYGWQRVKVSRVHNYISGWNIQ